MILSSEQIRGLLENPPRDPKDRLVISPVLEPNKQLTPGTASIDLRLGQNFHVALRTKLSELNRLSDEHRANMQRYKDETFVPVGDYFVLHPRQFVLGETLEWVTLPRNLSASVVGRSTWGRDGLIIATATGVHPNFSGVLTLELSNVGEIPIYLYPGFSIAQLFLHSVELVEGSGEPVPGAFQIQTSPRGRVPDVEDTDIIKAFKKFHQ